MSNVIQFPKKPEVRVVGEKDGVLTPTDDHKIKSMTTRIAMALKGSTSDNSSLKK